MLESLKSQARRLIQPWRERRSIDALSVEWRASTQSASTRSRDARCTLVIPSDPTTLTGARGDEAMVRATLDPLRAAGRADKVLILTATGAASTAARAMGFEPLEVWRRPGLADVLGAIEAHAPGTAFALGADIMDGYYSPVTTARVLAICDVLARAGARVAITGFSFNDRPSPLLRAAFERVHPSVALNLRDPISEQRFRAFCRAPATLVADVAFLLAPDASGAPYDAAAAWVGEQRTAARPVVAFNVHPMLIKGATDAQVERFVARAVDAIRAVSATTPVAWLLLPHDYRGSIGDDACLAPIAQRLAGSGVTFHHPSTPLSAPQLKAVAGLVDGVATGRMHLAIATLGQGVPVAGFTYQDKFQGLLQHFELPQWLLLSPQQMVEGDALAALLARFVDALPALRAQVVSRLPAVQALSRRNLDGLLGDAVR
jgi:polysaccharide pyruvyl transferase WcaK-like protein